MKNLKLCFPLPSLSSSSSPFSPSLFPCVCFVVWWFSFCPLFPSLPPLSRSKTTWTWSRTSGARATPGRSTSSRWDTHFSLLTLDFFQQHLEHYILHGAQTYHMSWTLWSYPSLSANYVFLMFGIPTAGVKNLVFITLSLFSQSVPLKFPKTDFGDS